MHTDPMLAERLKAHVYRLSHEIGERNIRRYSRLNEAADYITEQFSSFGYEVAFQGYTTCEKYCKNVIAARTGSKRPGDVIVLGAHYDSVNGPGADDNASAVAGVLETARIFAGRYPARTIKFIAFTNEEPPFFKRRTMGSRVYTKAALKNNENIRGAVILEMIGFFSSRVGSQRHPPGLNFFYPKTGNFIGVIGDPKSKRLLKRTVSSFRRASGFPIEWVVAPGLVVGIGMSDDWAFWKDGYPAVMITDTAYFRNPHYHKRSDTYDTLDYRSMAEVVKGVAAVVKALAK